MRDPLSKAEQELMNVLWGLEKARMRDLLESYSDPRPAATTIATLLKRMQDKGYISYTTDGRAREYFPLVSKSDYFGLHIKHLIHDFFNNSAGQFASFFTREADLDVEQLKELRTIIDSEIKKNSDG